VSQIGEKVDKSNEEFIKDTCPFCNQPEHPWPEKKEIDISKIESKPRSLGCGNLTPKQSKGKYGRARHHMIPVHQCYTRLRRIAAMGQSVGYNINGSQNGIPLPTAWNKYKVDGLPEPINFGDIEDEEVKDKIRNDAMKTTGAQWHVGNHHYDIPKKEDTTEDMEDEGELDHHPYDEVVLSKLLKIADKAVSSNLCDTKDQNKIQSALDKLCKDIETALNLFKNKPKDSYPYFVSIWAKNYERNG